MKNLISKSLIICLIVIFTSSCAKRKELLLKPPSDRPVYSIKVDDASEVDLLNQQLHLDIIKVKMNDVYFHAEDKSILKQLTDIGYSQPEIKKPEDVYMLLGKVVDKYDEEEIKRSGITVVNREENHLMVYGSIANLQALKNKGYILEEPDYEITPREIEVKVNQQPDIQKIYDMGVDIFSAVKDSGGGFLIRGGAFDFQIDLIQKMNYKVQVIKPK